jgi:dienelactone hydrolase
MNARACIAAALLLGSTACGGAVSPSGPSDTLGGTFPSGDIRLGYTLDLPEGAGPFPAVVLGHGSGRSTRNEATPLAARLVASGFAVLRYDKRGVGQSGGTYEGVGVANGERVIGLLGGDMAAGVAFLRTRPEVDPRRIGLLGVSQAGWVMPVAARLAPDVAFMVLIVGPTVSVGMEIYYSDLAEQTTTPLDEVYARMDFHGAPGFDPRPTLEMLQTPGLWLLGGQDRSIPTRQSVAILGELEAAGRPYRTIVYPGATHSMIDADTGAPVDFMRDALVFLERWRR